MYIVYFLTACACLLTLWSFINVNSEGVPYAHPSYTHLGWTVHGKFNIANVELKANHKRLILKIVDERSDFERERNFLASLGKDSTAEYVVELKDAIEPNSGEPRFCLVEELLGENLHDYLHKRPSLKELDRKNLALSVLNAIAAVHNKRVVHGDFKPHQICFDPNQRGFNVKLVDFDSAFSLDDGSHRLDRYTQLYAAPEVLPRTILNEFALADIENFINQCSIFSKR